MLIGYLGFDFLLLVKRMTTRLKLCLLPVEALISDEAKVLVQSQCTGVGHFGFQNHFFALAFDHLCNGELDQLRSCRDRRAVLMPVIRSGQTE